MATEHVIIPVNSDSRTNLGSEDYLKEIHFPPSLPAGRLPTLEELRQCILSLGYELEESGDWYVASADDHTTIWTPEDATEGDKHPWFILRGGDLIVLDIAQAIANHCGSQVVGHFSGWPSVLLVPNDVFPAASQNQTPIRFLTMLANRMPAMIEQLENASLDDTLFLLSQIRQAVHRTGYIRNSDLFRAAQEGLPAYTRLLKHADPRVRFWAFDLAASFRERGLECSESLSQAIIEGTDPFTKSVAHTKSLCMAIQDEGDTVTKSRMIYALERIIGTQRVVNQRIKRILDLLSALVDNANEPPPVRFSATYLLSRTQPGLLTRVMHETLTTALIHPEQFSTEWLSEKTVIGQTLESIGQLMLHHRIKILLAVLPEMDLEQHAPRAMSALLDHAFFGAICEGRSLHNGLYPANAIALTGEELLPVQRKVLETVIALDIPWTVHSNLLEKYGLPPTRALVRELLDSSE